MPYSLRSTKPQHNLSSHTDSTGVSHIQTGDSHSTTNSAQGFSTVMSFVNDLTAALSHPDVLHAFGVLIGTKVSEALSDYEDRIRKCEAKLAVKDKKIEELEAQLQECSLRTDEHENVLDDHELELGIEARIVLVLTRASLRLSCRTVEHGARVIKQNRRGSFRSVDMAGLAV